MLPWLRARSASAHLEVGRRGENAAVRFLKKAGFKILRRNFRPRRGGELDIVARDRDILVFVEVKSRSSDEFGRPATGIGHRQRARIRTAAHEWIRALDNPDIAYRFDVIEVISGEEPRHIRAAYSLAGR